LNEAKDIADHVRDAIAMYGVRPTYRFALDRIDYVLAHRAELGI
jgi:hypothetical protein